jgi:hypothetical protein
VSLFPEDVNFRVIKEDWCTWDIGNNCVLKIKLVLGKILKPPGIPLDKVRDFNFQARPFVVITAPVQRKGTPETKEITPELLEESIIEDVDPKPLTQNINEYELDNGAIFRLRIMLTRVARTDIFSADGTPVYVINAQPAPQFIFPTKIKRKTPSSIV